MMMKTVKRLLRPAVSRTLSPSTVRVLKSRWWYVSSYVPRKLSSGMVRRTANVRGFGPPNLANQLQNVNLRAPTEMCRIMTGFGSDKGFHCYTPIYSALFKTWTDRPLRMLELGLGSNFADMESNMGMFGAPGASLRGWRHIFPRALIYGADVDRRILFQEDRIKTFHCDQLDQASIKALWSQPELQDGADIILEDGLHTFEANISFLQGSLDHVRPGGIYITEDVGGREYFEDWYKWLESFSKKYPTHEFAFVDLEDGGFGNMLVVRRPAK
jgi:hypothetical protein